MPLSGLLIERSDDGDKHAGQQRDGPREVAIDLVIHPLEAPVRTVDEMAHAWMNVVYLNDDEYKALVAERKAKAAATSTRDQQQ